MAELTRVFVYGTLKKSFPNHKFLSQLASNQVVKFIGNAKTVEKYPMVLATPANIPFLLDAPSKGEHVGGEVYEVCNTTLAKLDELEEEGVLYHRKAIPVMLSDIPFKDEHLNAHTYVLTSFKEYLLDLSFLSSFSQQHALTYASKDERECDAKDIRSHVKH